jgi:hypothetical protein
VDKAAVNSEAITEQLEKEFSPTRLQWMKYTFSAVLAGLIIKTAGESLVFMFRQNVSMFQKPSGIIGGLARINWFYFFSLAYLIANVVRHQLRSFADDLLRDRTYLNTHFARECFEFTYSIVAILALSFAGASITDRVTFSFACLVAVALDLFFVAIELLYPAAWRVKQSESYKRWLQNWAMLSFMEGIAWMLILRELSFGDQDPLLAASAVVVILSLALDGWFNLDFWQPLSSHQIS